MRFKTFVLYMPSIGFYTLMKAGTHTPPYTDIHIHTQLLHWVHTNPLVFLLPAGALIPAHISI